MCGLVGFRSLTSAQDGNASLAQAMADRIRHRGPDGEGVWVDSEAGFAVAHRRLSILDLSAAGHQPMLSTSGRFVLAYNGEVYNHLALREQLQVEKAAPEWRGHSDTETLLASFEAWGIERTLRASVGMFAIALWDRSERALYLARDRIGEKPLYFGWQGDTFLFGSELKALRAHPAFSAAVDRNALTLLLRQGCVPGPYSIYAGIGKLQPGTWLKLCEGQRDVRPVAYWSLAEVAEHGTANPFTGSDVEAVNALEEKLVNAVRSQMISDVPLGGLLSGGVDSSLITALMQAISDRPVSTFTIGYSEKEFDEAGYAHAVAAHLGTKHTELFLSGRDAMDLIPQLPMMYDEPFADSSQLPTHLVMKLARRHVTVALSGDAGDEFFGGYNRYIYGPKTWRHIGWMPAPLRKGLGAALTALPASYLNRVAGPVAAPFGIALPGDKAHKLGVRLQGLNNMDDLFVSLLYEWIEPVVLNGHIPPNLLDLRECWPKLDDPVSRMMALDGLTYLPNDILVKVDRAAMAVSLETRAPFLDRDLMEFAWSLPMSMKLRNGKGKWILRKLLDRYVPRELIERPKMGFAIPLDAWLRGPLRDWAETLLAEDRLRQEGYFDPVPIRAAWLRHVRGEASFGSRLWSVLMFQAWLEQQGTVT
jgi:asparagine synthase (glutamine-hydrolysing)